MLFQIKSAAINSIYTEWINFEFVFDSSNRCFPIFFSMLKNMNGVYVENLFSKGCSEVLILFQLWQKQAEVPPPPALKRCFLSVYVQWFNDWPRLYIQDHAFPEIIFMSFKACMLWRVRIRYDKLLLIFELMILLNDIAYVCFAISNYSEFTNESMESGTVRRLHSQSIICVQLPCSSSISEQCWCVLSIYTFFCKPIDSRRGGEEEHCPLFVNCSVCCWKYVFENSFWNWAIANLLNWKHSEQNLLMRICLNLKSSSENPKHHLFYEFIK